MSAWCGRTVRVTETTILPPFEVTRAAVDAIGALGGCVRIDVEQGGCCG